MNAKQSTGKQKLFLCAAFLLALMGLGGLLAGVWNVGSTLLLAGAAFLSGVVALEKKMGRRQILLTGLGILLLAVLIVHAAIWNYFAYCRQPAAQGKPEAPKPADNVPSESADAEDSAKKSGLPFGISARINAAMQLLSNDPMAFARCMLGHTGWLGRHLLRSVRMSGLDIFWTVTADEASATAELFGAEMALANNLLALVQQYIRVQSDRLWLEPDFTGERAGERIVSFRLTSCAAVLLWLVIRLLHRLWKDPQLQPAAKA